MLNFLVADPDLQIGGPPVLPDPEIRRGGGDLKKIFWPLRASVWSKNNGGEGGGGEGGRPGPFPRSATDFNTS